MSVFRWRYDENCEGRYCCGDCDKCDKEDEEEHLIQVDFDKGDVQKFYDEILNLLNRESCKECPHEEVQEDDMK